MSLFPLVPTGLDLNGPDLSFTTNPVGVATSTAGTATFTGIATASFTTVGDVSNSPDNLGIVTYQWYKVGLGSLTDGTTLGAGISVAGAQTSTLTITSLTNDINQGEFYLQVDYVPTFVVGVASTSLGGYSTGNASNEPLNSDTVILTVYPEITIVDQPTQTTVASGATHTFSVHATATDGSNSDLSYKWQQNGTDLVDSSTVAGSATTQVSISSTTVGVSTIRCKITHPTANPSPVYSNSVDDEIVSPRPIIAYETFSENSTTLNSSGNHDLTDGSLSFRADTSAATRSITIYPSEKDTEVKITMGGSAGGAQRGNLGGEGGLSVFKITLVKDVEYTIKLGTPFGTNLPPMGGAVEDDNSTGSFSDRGGGGGSAVLYRKANVVAVCGGGGGGSSSGKGGSGGGVGVAGEGGHSINGGGGGARISTGEMGTSGSYATEDIGTVTTSLTLTSSSNEGGYMPKCTIGDYYAEQGFAPCEDVGTVVARTFEGDVIYGSGEISRGYKAGSGYRQNGGNAGARSGAGGAGARGGDGPSTGWQRPGGGGSGYSNGEVTLLTSGSLDTGTRLGGNSDTAFITIEATSVASDNEPVIPTVSSLSSYFQP